MKTKIMSILFFLLVTQNLAAEQSMSKIEHEVTQDCTAKEIERVIRSSAGRIMYSDKNLTLLEDALQITSVQKKAGTTAVVTDVRMDFDLQSYSEDVEVAYKTVADAGYGKVLTLSPRQYQVFYSVRESEQVVKQGVIQTLITCRIEKKDENAPITTTARLVSFQIDPTGK